MLYPLSGLQKSFLKIVGYFNGGFTFTRRMFFKERIHNRCTRQIFAMQHELGFAANLLHLAVLIYLMLSTDSLSSYRPSRVILSRPLSIQLYPTALKSFHLPLFLTSFSRLELGPAPFERMLISFQYVSNQRYR